jgi:hypothetical protein
MKAGLMVLAVTNPTPAQFTTLVREEESARSGRMPQS